MKELIYLTTNKYKLREAEIGDEDPARKASFYGNAIDDFAEWLKEQN